MNAMTPHLIQLRRATASWLCSLALVSAAHAHAQTTWPTLPEPPHLEKFDIANQMQLNGLPLKIQGFVSDRSVSDLNRWYRDQISGHFVENKIQTKTILGQKLKDHFLAIEMDPLLSQGSGNTTKVIVSLMQLKAPAPESKSPMRSLSDWANRLPLNSRLLSTMTNQDEGYSSVHIIGTNGHSRIVNTKHFHQEFRRLGYHRVDTGFPATSSTILNGEKNPTEDVLIFTSGSTEAVVVIGRNQQSETTIVMNIHVKK